MAKVWNEISLLSNTIQSQNIWTLKGKFSSSLVYGIIYTTYQLLLDSDPEAEYKYFFKLDNIYMISSLSELSTMIDGVVLVLDEQVSTNEALKIVIPGEGNILLWIYTHKDERSMYWDHLELNNISETAEMLQGFISICNAFKVDFRDRLLTLPIDKNGVMYDLPEYQLAKYKNII